jgi:Tol biopolymer transport system component
VFVRDRRTGQTEKKSMPTNQPNALAISGDRQWITYPVARMRAQPIQIYSVKWGTMLAQCPTLRCDQPSLSATGRYHAYVGHNTSGAAGQRIVVDDNESGGRETVATLGHDQPSAPSISGDGRYVAYQDGQTEDVLLWDRTTGTTSGPLEGAAKSASLVQISDDGRKVVYRSGSDTYVHDVASGTAQTVPDAKGAAIDPTGRYLLYAPTGTGGPSLVLRDLQTGADETVSDQPATAKVDAVSAGGRDVVFQSAADGIVPGDTDGASDVFVRSFF